jgi:hypothetical protein
MAISSDKKHKVFMKTFYHCGYCGKIINEPSDLTLDHMKPKAKGGTDEMNNLIGCCKSCNQMKSDKTMEEYRKELIKAVNISNTFYGDDKYNPNIQFFFEKYTSNDLMKMYDFKKQSDMSNLISLSDKINNLTKYVDYLAEKINNDISKKQENNIFDGL